ncbi:hypothetical protein [Emticicia soli]|uniref:Uncharacterized protein n=1 Tax=Emticicia soli TaxID=2027878 RepID=A0ABW5JF95_9BACT
MAGHFIDNINLEKSVFILAMRDEKRDFIFHQKFNDIIENKEDYLRKNKLLRQEMGLTIYPRKIVLNKIVDLIFLSGLNNQHLISESLKNAIIEAQITGLNFSESDIEFEVTEEKV